MKTLPLLLALTSLPAVATDVTLNIEGNIYDTTCQVDGGSQNMVVDLGQGVASDFRDIGDTGPWKNSI